jgi:hypothetical protein
MNEGPRVARREQSKEGMMDGWMDEWYGFRAQGIHSNGRRGKKSWYYPLLRKRDGVVQYSTPEVKEVFLAQLVFLGRAPRRLTSGPSASAAAARAVPARPASLPGSAIVAR